MKNNIPYFFSILLHCSILVSAKAQIKFSIASATLAMNSNNQQNFLNNVNSGFNTNSVFTSTTNNIKYVDWQVPDYSTTVQVYYGVPGFVFSDWLALRWKAMEILSSGPGRPNSPNYVDSDIPALNKFAYEDYVNPSAYGTRSLKILVQQYTGNLYSFSSTSGGFRPVKNWLKAFMVIKGTIRMQIQ